MVNLSQKEQTLLKDQKSHEEMCIKKYTKYSKEAEDPELKQLFNQLASEEQEHLNTVNQILAGQVPSMNSAGGSQKQNMQFSGNNMNNQHDADLCQDLLATEKYISSTYDTTIFECKDANIREALNHIQKEEQEHGEKIYNYMNANGMYN
ncbi:MAG: spore coat protein [Tissierella sp.]|uniref:spore coat protein n=1 Tax=Tissierella sp. TaxID=41274 RepID=UPI003F9734F5